MTLVRPLLTMPINTRTPGTDDESLLFAIVKAVADRAGKPPTDLPPLYRAIDPGALDALFRDTDVDGPREGGEVMFPYAGYCVHISTQGTAEVVVSEPTG